MRSWAWGTAALAILAAGLPGCIDDGSSVFGPVAGDEGEEAAGLLPVSFKAKPARGPTPLEAGFFLHVTGQPDLEWSIDFGDGSKKASGDGLPANATHRFTKVGEVEVVATVGTGMDMTRSRLVLEVLPADAPPADPDEEAEGKTIEEEPEDAEEPEPEEPEEPEESEEESESEETEAEETSDPTSSSSPETTAPDDPEPSSSPEPTPTPQPPPSSSTTSTTRPPPPPASSSSTSTTQAPPPPPPPPPPSSSTTSSAPPPPPPSDNEPPQASLTASRTSGSAPLDVAFSMDARDPEGRPIQWTLDIGNDGSIEASGDRFDLPRTVNGHFERPGTYVTVFAVTDGVSTTTRSVTVTAT